MFKYFIDKKDGKEKKLNLDTNEVTELKDGGPIDWDSYADKMAQSICQMQAKKLMALAWYKWRSFPGFSSDLSFLKPWHWIKLLQKRKAISEAKLRMANESCDISEVFNWFRLSGSK